jgi:6-phosphogluconolactonase
MKRFVVGAVAVLAAWAGAAVAADGKTWVFVGTYTRDNGSKGIYRCAFDAESGKLSAPELAAETKNPSFLALHPSGKFLFAVGEHSDLDGRKSGGVSGFALDPATGALKALNTASSGGAGPCHLVVDKAGRTVLVANYGGGTVATLAVAADGTLSGPVSRIQHEGKGPNPRRQEGPHAHSINLDADNRFAVAADLGLDKLLVYKFDPAKHTITPNDVPSFSLDPGAGPRHFAFHPKAPRAYAINELTSTLTALDYDPTSGTFAARQTVSTLPTGFAGNNSTAEVVVHPSGKFVYGSNRGHHSIAGFSIDSTTGQLKPIGHTPTQGRTPRNFNIDPAGNYLIAANQDTNNLVVFRINTQTGALTPTGHTVEVKTPVCVRFLEVK